MRDRFAALALSLLALGGLAACSDDGSGDQAAAGGPPTPMMVGDLCLGPDCPQGTVCASTGRLAGQCTATCSGDMGCLLLGPRAHCVGSQCAITCTTDADCVEGTACIMLSDRMVCVRQ